MQPLKSQRDEPNTLREYETIYVLRPGATSDQIHSVNDRVRKVIIDQGGKVVRLDNWGKRKLAYEIRKELKGIYLYWLYLANAGLVEEIERNLRMNDLCIRHFTVVVDGDVHPDARPTTMDDESFAAAATLVPDEEDAYLVRKEEEAREAAAAEPAKADEATDKPATDKPATDKPATDKPATDKPAKEAEPTKDKDADGKDAKAAKEE